jgi:carboxypeptidase C (cathepsin A)
MGRIKVDDWHMDQIESKKYKENYKTVQEFCNDNGFSKAAIYEGIQHRKGKSIQRRKHRNVVYMAFFGDHVKIGRTTMLKKRIENLKVCNPLPMDAMRIYLDEKGTLEKDLHKRFSKDRVRGEWFLVSEEIAEYANNNLGEQPREKK